MLWARVASLLLRQRAARLPSSPDQVATNLGPVAAGGPIRRPSDRSVRLPLTNPATGSCLAPPTPIYPRKESVRPNRLFFESHQWMTSRSLRISRPFRCQRREGPSSNSPPAAPTRLTLVSGPARRIAAGADRNRRSERSVCVGVGISIPGTN